MARRERWSEFEASHRETKSAGLAGKAAMLAVFSAAGGLGGALFGYFFPAMFLRHDPYNRDPFAAERAMQVYADSAELRIIAGAVLGAILVLVSVIQLWRRMNRD